MIAAIVAAALGGLGAPRWIWFLLLGVAAVLAVFTIISHPRLRGYRRRARWPPQSLRQILSLYRTELKENRTKNELT